MDISFIRANKQAGWKEGDEDYIYIGGAWDATDLVGTGIGGFVIKSENEGEPPVVTSDAYGVELLADGGS